jgi:hypothetical protein
LVGVDAEPGAATSGASVRSRSDGQVGDSNQVRTPARPSGFDLNAHGYEQRRQRLLKVLDAHGDVSQLDPEEDEPGVRYLELIADLPGDGFPQSGRLHIKEWWDTSDHTWQLLDYVYNFYRGPEDGVEFEIGMHYHDLWGGHKPHYKLPPDLHREAPIVSVDEAIQFLVDVDAAGPPDLSDQPLIRPPR